MRMDERLITKVAINMERSLPNIQVQGEKPLSTLGNADFVRACLLYILFQHFLMHDIIYPNIILPGGDCKEGIGRPLNEHDYACQHVTVSTVNEGCREGKTNGSIHMSQLKKYVYTFDSGGPIQTDILVELLGPQNPSNAIPIILSVPHGGSKRPEYIRDRSCKECKVLKDVNTLEIALEIKDEIRDTYCKVPYIIVNHLHRQKMDANRDEEEASLGDPIAEQAWQSYHSFILDAQLKIKSQFGTVVNTKGKRGIVGLLLDIHGYSGFDWKEGKGAPFIQWGYGLNTTSLDQNFSLDLVSEVSTLEHAMFLHNMTLECLIRGPMSLSSRIKDHSDCGISLPSEIYPSPKQVALCYCSQNKDMNESVDRKCKYFSGGYTIKNHTFLNQSEEVELVMNTIQVEFPRCIRYNATYRTTFVLQFAIGVRSFLFDLFNV
jgi:hypothetical protein